MRDLFGGVLGVGVEMGAVFLFLTYLQRAINLFIGFHAKLYTWNPNDPCFAWKRPCSGGLTFKNRDYLGSRYIYIYTLYPYMFSLDIFAYRSTVFFWRIEGFEVHPSFDTHPDLKNLVIKG